jgi:hypothetical protein
MLKRREVRYRKIEEKVKQELKKQTERENRAIKKSLCT